MAGASGFDVMRMLARGPARRARSSVQDRMRRQAIERVEREPLVHAAYHFRIVPLEAPAGQVLVAGGERLEAPRLLPPAGELTALACGAATLGAALEHRVSALFAERRVSLALALDDLGNELLLAVTRRAQDRMLAEVRRRGLTMAGELRPGDPGLALEAQAAVLRLAQAERIGVSLGRGSMMRPVKSTSMLLGVGIALPRASWSRCDTCPRRERCCVARAELHP
ncbi:MAG: hypothetical protein A2W21_13925 [Betaproteobacteria bacterium RBG_16_66_20]|nr:MAG: hypothetical protein A2W21_13925 [Betaproteobacteria bacterium RBG_16_66_20]